MRSNKGTAAVRLTERDKKLMLKLASARWLTTSQAAKLCFPKTSKVVPQRRLRLMRQDRYIHSVQLNPMAESIHSLGPRGRELVIRLGWPNEIKLERKPPKES